MKIVRIVTVALTVLLAGIATCKNDVSGPGGSESNLIKNPGFEDGGSWSYKYWTLSDTLTDTSQMFSEDVPPTGGSWSLRLEPAFAPSEGWARYYIPGESPRTAYRLTVWAKATNGWQGGYIALGVISMGQWTIHKQTAVNSGSWEPYTLEDTVRLYLQDTLAVHFSAGSADITPGTVLFDEVVLQKQ